MVFKKCLSALLFGTAKHHGCTFRFYFHNYIILQSGQTTNISQHKSGPTDFLWSSDDDFVTEDSRLTTVPEFSYAHLTSRLVFRLFQMYYLVFQFYGLRITSQS